jgi:hypothetical protein
MTEAAATTQQTTTTTAETDLSGTVEQRADALFGPTIYDDGDETEADGSATEETAAAPAAPAAKTPEQLAAERKARRDADLAALKAKTRDGVDSKTAMRRAEELERQLQTERAERSALVDPRKLTPLQLLELGQIAGHTPQSIAEALKAARDNPEYAAQNAARKVVDPELAALRQQNQALESKVETFLQRQQRQEAEAAEQAAYGQLADFTSQNAATAPYTASFIKTAGADKFRKTVEHVLEQGLVVGGGPQAVVDAVEDFLIAEHSALRQQLDAWNPTAAAGPQRTQANQPRSLGTATQAPTHVTNSLAQQRSSVVNEEADLEAMPYQERASFIFGRR